MDLEYKIKDNQYYNIKEIIKNEFMISDRLLRKLKNNNKIFLNNIPININHSFSLNDIISVNLDFEEKYTNIVPTQMKLDILYEDDCFLIINKPSGIPVHPSQNYFENSLSNGVKFYFDSIGLKRKIRIVNRLDKDTSGIVIFAKNEYIQECLIKQMKNNIFKKEYLAVLTGTLLKSSGTISAPISRKDNSIIERCVDYKNGEIAITHYNVIKTNKNYTCVHFLLETGRTHQIRVHSAHIGNPILGDSLYGEKSTLIDRQALHCFKMTFLHPILRKEIQLEAPLPQDMRIFF